MSLSAVNARLLFIAFFLSLLFKHKLCIVLPAIKYFLFGNVSMSLLDNVNRYSFPADSLFVVHPFFSGAKFSCMPASRLQTFINVVSASAILETLSG